MDWFRKYDKQSYIKCFDLTRELIESHRSGQGKPERLKYFKNEVYSRRINLKDRLVYTILKPKNQSIFHLIKDITDKYKL